MHAAPVEAGDPFHLKMGKYQLILGQDGATLCVQGYTVPCPSTLLSLS